MRGLTSPLDLLRALGLPLQNTKKMFKKSYFSDFPNDYNSLIAVSRQCAKSRQWGLLQLS
jgi:hypothetical protein